MSPNSSRVGSSRVGLGGVRSILAKLSQSESAWAGFIGLGRVGSKWIGWIRIGAACVGLGRLVSN